MKSYRHLYSRFLAAHPGVQHFACHSHHYWPDVTLDAQIQYWEDSCKYVDEKWDYFFAEKLPQAQRLIAEVLGFSKPAQIVFASNTHELSSRLLSCFPFQTQKIKILTTDSEFYSFDRQLSRLEEAGVVEAVRVPTMPFATFEERFKAEAQNGSFDMVFFSEVFFNSGVAVADVEAIVRSVPDSNTTIVVDGYHGYMAVPTNYHAIEDRIFYLAGSYKYSQGGEGCSFMWVPAGCTLRPQNTSWFAGFGALARYDQKVSYADNGFRFAGATMDYSALYRSIAALELFQNEGLSVSVIHKRIQKLQSAFLNELDKRNHPVLNRSRLLQRNLSHHGHFLTFQCDNSKQCSELALQLKSQKILTDHRGDRLRFGFGLYHDLPYTIFT